MLHKNRWALGAIAGAIILAAAGIGLAVVSNSRADDPQATFTQAIENGRQAGDAPAAIVNGVVITKSNLAQIQTMLLTFPANGVDATSTTSVINYLVSSELIRQEAARRGLEPTADEVTAAILEVQQGYQKDQAAGTLPEVMVNILAGEAKIGHPLSGWNTDPVFRSAWSYMLAKSNLAGELAKDIPQNTNDAGQLIQSRMNALVQQLRDSGKVQVLVK